MISVYFLGTGTSQGIPVIGSSHPVCLSSDSKDKRLRVSVWIKTDSESIVVDCGPDFRQQMLQSKCDRLDAVLFTHEHADHTAGLDDIRPFTLKKGALPIYAEKRVLENLKYRFDYIFATENKYPGAPDVAVIEIKENVPFYVGKTKIIPIRLWHGKLPIFGYRVDNFAYLTDVKSIEKSEIDKLLGLKVLVVNALRIAEHQTHFSLQEALEFVNLVQPEQAFFTHISHLLGFHSEVEKSLPKNVFLAFDNLQLDL